MSTKRTRMLIEHLERRLAVVIGGALSAMRAGLDEIDGRGLDDETELNEIVEGKWLPALARAGITTVGDLRGRSENELLQIQGVNVRTVQKLRQSLDPFGIQIGDML